MKAMMRCGTVMVMMFAAVLAGCAGHRHRSADRVIVDTKGVDLNAYYRDLDECQHYADDVAVGRRAAGGAVAGAVIGGAVGAIAGNSRTAERAAGVGGVVGGAKGVGSGLRERDRVVKNCLVGRGYLVLN
jgi:ABC-type nitrate/sulfonate/bicarbonate transport system permease component